MKKFFNYAQGLGLLVLLFGGILMLFAAGIVFQGLIVGVIVGFFHLLVSFVSK